VKLVNINYNVVMVLMIMIIPKNYKDNEDNV